MIVATTIKTIVPYVTQSFVRYPDNNSRIWISTRIELDKRNDMAVINGIDRQKTIPLSQMRFFKFMKIKRFLQVFQNKALPFMSPSTWYDAYDKRLYDAAFMSPMFQRIFCFCCSYSFANDTEAMWRMYGQPWDTIVRVSMNFQNLLDSLNDFSREKDLDIYVSLIDYSLEQKQIRGLVNRYANLPNVSIPEWISLMSLKRKAFSYEHEIRFSIVTHSDATNTYINRDLFSCPVLCNNRPIVTQVTLPPIDPSKKWLEDIASILELQGYSQQNNIAKAKASLQAVIPPILIKQSRLYEW